MTQHRRKSDGPSFEHFQEELSRLVAKFDKGIEQYKGSEYNEAKLRSDFLDPFFRALGWDLENKSDLIQQYREVEIESRTEIAGRKKRADYLFRTDRTDRFVCEAKKPAEELHAGYAYQAKRYAWNKGLVLAVLSDFEEMKIYVVGSKPHPDEEQIGLWNKWGYKDYPKAAKELWRLLARPSVAEGSIDKLIEGLPRKQALKGKARQQWLFKPERTRALDYDFLDFLDEARRELAQDLIHNNDKKSLLEGTQLNEAVQKILDRLLFLRICEDRDIDTGHPLALILKSWGERTGIKPHRKAHQTELPVYEERADNKPKAVAEYSLWREVVAHFRALDRRPPSHIPFFNGNLFKPHFSEEIEVSNKWISDFLEDVSADESPYLFNVIPVEILGTIYERFLGKVVRPHGRGAVIEEKPEVRKAGGVYYTPRYIVDYIVEQTVGKLLENATPKESMKLRILDPACGSGSFLIRAFERLCEYWQSEFTKNPELRRERDCWVDPATKDVHLTTKLKCRILTECIYGVDIDPGAVEVTQLSLYLKMLEGENRTTMAHERDIFGHGNEVAILPPLQDNIKNGNSLIASDFSMMPEDLLGVKAFDWQVQFSDILKRGGFDAVIGNPPYGAAFNDGCKSYITTHYSSYRYKFDSYIYFIEKGITLLCKGGYMSFITPELWLKLESAEPLRKYIHDNTAFIELNICGENVFEDAVINTITFTLKRGYKTNKIVIDGKIKPWEMQETIWVQTPGLAIDYRLDPKIHNFIDKLQGSKVRPLSDFGEAIQGITPYDKYRGQTKELISNRGYHFDKKKDKSCGKWLAGEDIARYDLNWSREWLSYGPWLGAPREPRFFSGPRLLFREIPGVGRRMQATYVDAETYYHGHSITPFKLFEKADIDILFLLGLVNSKLLSWYGGLILPNFGKEVFPKLNPQDIKQLPIVHIDRKTPHDRSVHDKLVALVEKMLSLVPQLHTVKTESEKTTIQNAITSTDQQIDELVYELYGLTKEEIKLVEKD